MVPFRLTIAYCFAVIIHGLPEVLEIPPQTKRVGEDAFINCTVKGLSDPDVVGVYIYKVGEGISLTLSKNDVLQVDFNPEVAGVKKYEISSRFLLLNSQELTEYSLLVRRLKMTDSGGYECYVLLKSTFNYPMQRGTLTILDSNLLEVRVRALIQLPCEIAREPLVDEVVWYKDGSPVYKPWKRGDPTEQVSERFKLYQDQLDIKDAIISDSAKYTCSSFINGTNTANVSTDLRVIDRPSPPGNLVLTNKAARLADIKWDASDNHNSPIQSYNIYVKYRSAEWSDSTLYEINSTTYLLTLEPFTEYDVRVNAENKVGESDYSDGLAFITMEDIPAAPRIINLDGQQNTTFNVTWERPQPLNGKLLQYTIYVKRNSNGSLETKHGISGSGLDVPMMTQKIERLIPYTEYCVEVQAKNGAGVSAREKSGCPYRVLTDVAGPSAPYLQNVTSNSTGTLVLAWDPPEKFNKTIDLYQVKLIGKPFDGKTFTNYSEMQLGDTVIRNLEGNVTYKVRIRAATKSLFKSSDTQFKFNYGEFSNEKSYALKASGIPPVKPTPAPPSIREGELAGIIVGAALLVVIIVIVFTIITKRKRKDESDDYWITTNDVSMPLLSQYEENEVNSIGVEYFAEHVALSHADSNLRFSQEYDEINRGQDILTCNASLEEENKPKNRYTNILAYDHSRIKLFSLPEKKCSDYVNANYVDGYDKPRAYIATQGPLPNTIEDFWRCVWDKNCVVVIMITNLYEKGRKKCDQYWPEEGVEMTTTSGLFSIKLLSKVELAHYTERVFTVKHCKTKKKHSAERIVYQYHYTDWPDHGVPDYALPVLSFIQKSSSRNTEMRPILIHCSAGVGRTGTYIAIQSMIEQIKTKGTVSVFDFLKHIRTQRNYLVQTEDQYVFVHDALLEYIQNGGHTEVKEKHVNKYVEQLLEENLAGETELDKQFKLATSYCPKRHDYETANKPCNGEKNRSNIVPADNKSRVKLPMQPGMEGSDYINASYLHGYYQNEEYIVTQHPLRTTIQDFWRMVWDQNSMTIIMLSEVHENHDSFWSDKDEILDWEAGNFKVTSAEVQYQLDHVVRDFMLESKQDDYELKTRMLSITNWPETYTPVSSVFDFIKTARAWHTDHQAGPIIVVDSVGGSKAAIFCALMTLHNQLIAEKTVDVYGVFKLYHQRRPYMFNSKDDLSFIYQAVESICTTDNKVKDSYTNDMNTNGSPHVQLRTFGGSPRSSEHTMSLNSAYRMESTI